jgi:hypothetical protein
MKRTPKRPHEHPVYLVLRTLVEVVVILFRPRHR